MKFQKLGQTDIDVSIITLGCWAFAGGDLWGEQDEADSIATVHAALDVGVNFFDTAEGYGSGYSEEVLGRALVGRRNEAVIATKVSGKNNSAAAVQQSCENSLRRLQTDYIDLYQIHRWDTETPIEETLRALDDLVSIGKVRYIGASNFTAWQLAWSIAIAEMFRLTKFVSIQPHYHMFERGIETELIPACQYIEVGILPYFPLAGGFLTGKYLPGQPAPPSSRGESSQYVQSYMSAENYTKLEKLRLFAQESDHTVNELAHAWLLAQPQISSVISGATRVEHVHANAAAGDWELTPDEVTQINTILDSP